MTPRDGAEAIIRGCDGDPERIRMALEIVNLVSDEVLAEREACARIASGMSDGMDCDDRGAQDRETGEVPCSAEARGEVCVCSERCELAFKIAAKIRARSLPTQ